MNKLLIALSTSALALTGCASMTDMADSAAGLGQIDVETNQFDNSKVIVLSPDALYNPEGGFSSIDAKMGAIWSSKTPNYFDITLKYDNAGYASFRSLSVNIDDQIHEFRAGGTSYDTNVNGMLRTISTSSLSRVAVPVEVVREMVNAEKCLMKISSNKGYEVASCNRDRIPGGKKTAVLGFKKLLEQI